MLAIKHVQKDHMAHGHQERSYLAALTALYSAVFLSLSKSVEGATKGMTKYQKLYREMGTTEIASLQLSLNTQETALKNEAAAQSNAASIDGTDSNIAEALQGVGIALIVVTFVAGFLTAGAADAAIPEEMAAMGADAGAESSAGATGTDEVEMADMSRSTPTAPSEGDEDPMAQMRGMMESEARAGTDYSDPEYKAQNIATSTGSTVKRKLMEIVLSLAVSAPNVSVQALQARTNFANAKAYAAVAAANEAIGPKEGQAQELVTFVQYDQNALQRGENSLQQMVSGPTNVVALDSDTMKAQSAMTTALLQARVV